MILLNRLKKIRNIALSFISVSLLACSSAGDKGYISQEEVRKHYESPPFPLPEVKVPAFANYQVSIAEFGAVCDGKFLNTKAIQNAIDHVAERGGGTVRIPAGIWFTGPIELKSNVNLHAEANALVVFSPDYHLYPIVETSWEGVETRRAQSPITARHAENIAITGRGVFNGSGDAWRPVKKDKITDRHFNKLVKSGGALTPDGKTWYPSEASLRASYLCVDQNVPEGLKTDEEWKAIHDFLRPVLVNIISCRNVLLDGVTFENSPSWNLHPLMSENIILNNLTVRNPWYSQNGDGVDLESCTNALIVNCNFDVGDDAICMKSGKNDDGRARNMPTENVVVRNCIVYHGHGGFVVGSEMSGDIRNIWVDSCTFVGTDVGLRFKSTRGRGGIVENIHISGINMINIPTDPLSFDLFYGGNSPGEEPCVISEPDTIHPVTAETPVFRDIYIDKIVSVNSRRAMYFNGLPEMKVKNIHVSNSFFSSLLGAEINRADGITFTNVCIDHRKGDMLSINDVQNALFDQVTDSKGGKVLITEYGENPNIKIVSFLH